MITTKTNWSGPNVIHFGRKSQFGPDQFILVVTISFWSWPNHYGQVQINLVRPKQFWTDQNCFGHIEGQGIRGLTRTIQLRIEDFHPVQAPHSLKPYHQNDQFFQYWFQPIAPCSKANHIIDSAHCRYTQLYKIVILHAIEIPFACSYIFT